MRAHKYNISKIGENNQSDKIDKWFYGLSYQKTYKQKHTHKPNLTSLYIYI
jgi:hypothetical protein